MFQNTGTGHWNKLPRATVIAPSWLEFKSIWAMFSDIGIEFCVVLCGVRSWTQWSLCVPSNPGESMIPWKWQWKWKWKYVKSTAVFYNWLNYLEELLPTNNKQAVTNNPTLPPPDNYLYSLALFEICPIQLRLWWDGMQTYIPLASLDLLIPVDLKKFLSAKPTGTIKEAMVMISKF